MTVLYRKWRPQTFAEVAGQEPVTRILLNALRTGRVAHAYLFAGPRGTGKTSTGRILAKAVNCLENGSRDEPCNRCLLCLETTEGRSPDVVEVDAASNRGIDEIRSLRERVAFSPARGRYKVYIIDEVHMLTEPASNAILKTLEEPPPHIIFILATTEPHQVLPTVLSRCQRFDFRRLTLPAILSRLEHIALQEGFLVNRDALGLIARAASGSLRDAENLVEQAVNYYGNQVELAQVKEMLGLREDLRSRELVGFIIHRDLAGGLSLLHRLSAEGADLRAVQREVVTCLRSLLLVKGGSAEAVEATTEELTELKALAARASLQDIVQATRLFAEADLRRDEASPLPLELALAEAVGSQEKPAPPTVSPATPARRAPPAPEPPRPVGEPRKASSEPIPVAAGSPAPAPTPLKAAGPPAETPSFTLDYLRRHWRELVGSFRGMGSGGDLDARLRSACQPVAVEEDTVVLGFFHSWHKDKIEDPKYLYLVEKGLSRALGIPCRVRCILTPREKKLNEEPLVRAAMEMGARLVEGGEP